MRFLHEEEQSLADRQALRLPRGAGGAQGAAGDYFHTIFAGSRYEEPFIFRGFYITSGLQQGKPIARACRDLLRRPSGPRRVLENLEQIFKKSRAFFIKDFYEKKVFPEQGLIARPRRPRTREGQDDRLVFRGLSAFIVLLVLAG